MGEPGIEPDGRRGYRSPVDLFPLLPCPVGVPLSVPEPLVVVTSVEGSDV